MKKLIVILILLFSVNTFAQTNNNIERFPVVGGTSDTVMTYNIADAWLYDDHAFVVMADTLAGFAYSAGTVPTYTFTVQQIARVGIAGGDSTFVLYNNSTTSGVQTITSAATFADSARIWTITPTVNPVNALRFIVTVTGIPDNARWRFYLGYIGRRDRRNKP